MQPIKKTFIHYLEQLREIVEKLPSEILNDSLSQGMLPLCMHAKIAANFPLRGYCPLLGEERVSFFSESEDVLVILAQID